MGKKIGILIILIALFPANVKCQTTTEVFNVYKVKSTTELESNKITLEKTEKLYNTLFKKSAFTDFYNTAVSEVNNYDLLNELYTYQQNVQVLEYGMLNGIDLDRQELMNMDYSYIDTVDNVNSLLKTVDTYMNITYADSNLSSVTEAENKLSEARAYYDTVSAESDIGEVDNLIQPIQSNITVSKEFGTSLKKDNTKKTEFHNGIDLSAVEGTGVLSMFSGKVIFADFIEATGETVKIDHGDGLITVYSSLSERYVKTGDIVKQYQKIGTVGKSTKENNETHVHIEVVIHNKNYDPSKLFIRKED